MAEDTLRDLFAHVTAFDWHPPKRERNLSERQIDFQDLNFQDAQYVFDGPTIIWRSDRKGETRYMAFGFLDDMEVVVVFTVRGDVCWIISARRASRDERKKYHNRLPRRAAPQGKD